MPYPSPSADRQKDVHPCRFYFISDSYPGSCSAQNQECERVLRLYLIWDRWKPAVILRVS